MDEIEQLICVKTKSLAATQAQAPICHRRPWKTAAIKHIEAIKNIRGAPTAWRGMPIGMIVIMQLRLIQTNI